MVVESVGRASGGIPRLSGFSSRESVDRRSEPKNTNHVYFSFGTTALGDFGVVRGFAVHGTTGDFFFVDDFPVP